MARMGFEPTIPVFERAKAVHAQTARQFWHRTHDDGRLRLKHVRRRNKSEISCIKDRIYCAFLKIYSKCKMSLSIIGCIGVE
jgi:hypothetical protein